MKKKSAILTALVNSIKNYPWVFVGVIFFTIGGILTVVFPPLIMEWMVNELTAGNAIRLWQVVGYFLVMASGALMDVGKESMVTVFGQKVTHGIRTVMCKKLKVLPASYFKDQDTGNVVSRFVSDVDMIEILFTSGIIGMVADLCKLISILAVIGIKSPGLGLLLVFVLPIIYAITRYFQKRMKKAQLKHRQAVGRVSDHIPDTLRSIRMIHNLEKEDFMEKRYDHWIHESFEALNKVNLYDAVYSPLLIELRALIVAAMLVLAAMTSGTAQFFGMSVGTVVAMISYVTYIFTPLESIGMEIQNIQSAIAGATRIEEFMREEEISIDSDEVIENKEPIVEFRNVDFGYNKGQQILKNQSLVIYSGEHVTLAGRTGAGKSTMFRLLLGLYRPWNGKIFIEGRLATSIREEERRSLFGYVEQSFKPIPGTIAEQISLRDEIITREDVLSSLEVVGLRETVESFDDGIDTIFQDGLFSQGQIQLLAVARAIVANPKILLLDEITANLDSETESRLLEAFEKVSKNRTVISISHRLFEKMNKTRMVYIE
ncbi:ABC transporter, transmembrane region:ABC transporter [Lachnospiraceae bacterium TWA4]|nr:ABC transporter, transmembrane region:ABC transporter [Lachnospiraceae bacterium TWA4]